MGIFSNNLSVSLFFQYQTPSSNQKNSQGISYINIVTSTWPASHSPPSAGLSLPIPSALNLFCVLSVSLFLSLSPSLSFTYFPSFLFFLFLCVCLCVCMHVLSAYVLPVCVCMMSFTGLVIRIMLAHKRS